MMKCDTKTYKYARFNTQNVRKTREARRNNSKENQLVSYDNSLNGGIDPNILDFTI